MLTRLVVRNFKRLDSMDVELGQRVLLVGPNNSGKTAALQALSLWEVGLRRWCEQRQPDSRATRRTGVAVNRRDLLNLPTPRARLLWHGLRTHRDNRKIPMTVQVEGREGPDAWSCGLEFDWANEESLYVRPMAGSQVPEQAKEVRLAFLPAMSGLTSVETRLERGAVMVRLGEGRTAEVLRNLCHLLCEQHPDRWRHLEERIRHLFGCTVLEPVYRAERGELTMEYEEPGSGRLDLSSAGRGMQQILLLLSFLLLHPGAVVLLDEPDAHLEILRQRQVYQALTQVSEEHGSQILAASHSEVLLNEAARTDQVIAFLGRPHPVERPGQVLKALKDIGFDQYYLALQRGWVLYLEGSTDLAVLREFARKLNHPASALLEGPFVHYVANQPTRAREHFFGLKEASPILRGFALYDRLATALEGECSGLKQHALSRRELENYFCTRDVLLAWAEDAHGSAGRESMRILLEEFEKALALQQKDPWGSDAKASDEVLEHLMREFHQRLNLYNPFSKSDFHRLVPYLAEVPSEIASVLDGIADTASIPQR